ncbi:hypothetical protein GON26_13085 [Flavobacterium sp. GA093]|uniref:Uncharacterized protein n=1 Tax=Flavobacterium hydrocarbonoxydans TaxID=2683249 RepID=A0A6I4NLN9_9FLAO|nr:hypothetical protein [Flavobacterium hydrocarbonoxydans]MWB95296.1 hypothetical protein [Flavobacterium hydrocarbonoxydans]
MDTKYNKENDDKSQKERLNNEVFEQTEVPRTSTRDNFTVPTDLIDDLKKGKIDPLTEGNTHLGYEEKTPRKKELEQKEHLDRDDK